MATRAARPRQWLGTRAEASNIGRYEAYGYVPEFRTFGALARALGVSMEALLYGEDEAARIADERERAGDGAASPDG
jgi:hypothetical protein